MDASDRHRSSIVFDGLVIAKWERQTFERMRQGGLTAANCTVCIWQGIRETMINIARFRAWFDELSDLIMPCRTVEDIRTAKRTGKLGIVLGWQNSTGVEDRLDLLPVYRDLGVRFIQLTYNTQNYVASGCWEKRDGGLSAFGERFVHEMNRLGIVVDLSHVGSRSAADAIAVSARPCAYTHICPSGLRDHPRNKSDAQLREIVDKGGFVGVAAYAPFMKRGADSTLADVIEMFEYVIDVCGEQQVGIGTDFTEGQDEAFFDYIRQDKGYGQRMVPSTGVAPTVEGFGSLTSYPALTRAMEARRWSEQRIVGVLGENWLRFLERVW